MSIYLRLAGGLGNQLFQLAAARQLQKICTDGRIYVIDESLLSYSERRKAISLSLINSDKLKILKNGNIYFNILSNKLRIGKWLPFISYNDTKFRHGKYPLSNISSFVDGYFQHSWDLSDLISFIEEFIYIDRKIKIDIDDNTCVIHVRGGDFLKLPQYNICKIGYYTLATKIMIDRKITSYVIIGDDIEYNKIIRNELMQKYPQEQFLLGKAGSDPMCDFVNLTMAKLKIIGNSTFAWWGMACSMNRKQGFSIAPSHWKVGVKRDINLPWETTLDI